MAHARENSLEAFHLAGKMGATGLESDVWPTADQIPVLHHDRKFGNFFFKKSLPNITSELLPAKIPTLAELYQKVGTEFQISLDIKDISVVTEVISVSLQHNGAIEKLWLCHPEWRTVAEWRSLDEKIKLVDSTRLSLISEGPERRAASLAKTGINAVNLHESDWSTGLVTMFHRFGIQCFGWDAQHKQKLDRLFKLGIDGVYSDHVDRMVTSFSEIDEDL